MPIPNDIGPIGSTGSPTTVGPTSPTFQSDLPAPEPLEPGKIKVISPTGEAQQLDIDWLLKPENSKIFAEEGWSLPQGKAPDLIESEPGKIKVISPAGEAQQVARDWLADPNNQKIFADEGWKISKKSDEDKAVQVNQELSDLDKTGWKELEQRHQSDDVQDKDGNYKLLAPNGEPILATQKQLIPLLMSGFRFKDDNFQSLYDAHIQLGAQGGAKKGFEAGAAGYVGSVPGFDWLRNKAIESSDYKPGKAWTIANQVLEKTTQATEHKVGTGLGIAAQIAIPSGIFGEVKLAQAAKAATLGKLLPEGAGFLQTLGARAAGGLVEGAIISAPQAIAQAAIDENPKAAAESILAGAGIGLVLGAGAPILSKGAELGLSGFKKGAETVGGFFEKRNAAKLAEISGGSSAAVAEKEIAQAAGPVERARLIGSERGIQLNALETADNVFNISLAELKQSAGKSKEKFIDGLRKISEGERLESWLPKLDKTIEKETGAPAINVLDLMDQIKKDPYIAEQLIKDSKKEFALQSLNEKLSSMADKSGYLGTSDLQKFIKQVGEEINWKNFASGDSNKIEMFKAVYYGSLKKELNKTISTVFGQKGEQALIKDPEMIHKWATEGALLDKYYNTWGRHINDPESLLELNPLIQAGMDLIANKTTGAIAGSVGGIPGMIVGAGAGKATETLKEKVSTAIIDAYKNSDTKLGKFLVKNKEDQAIGSYLSLDAIKNMNTKIGEIPQYLRDIGGVLKVGSIKTADAFIGAQDPIKSILGNEANGLSKAQQYQRLSAKLASASSSPEVMQHNFDLHIAPIFQDHPELMKQLQSDYKTQIDVLNQIVNAHDSKQPVAFQGKEKKSQPTSAQLAETESLLRVAINPYALLDGFKNGKVTAKQVGLVAQLNPAILQKMREELTKEAYSGKSKLSYQQRLSASIIMGNAMDQSLRNGQALQATYGADNAAPQDQQSAPKSKGNSKSLKPSKISDYTSAQRISKL